MGVEYRVVLQIPGRVVPVVLVQRAQVAAVLRQVVDVSGRGVHHAEVQRQTVPVLPHNLQTRQARVVRVAPGHHQLHPEAFGE